MICVKTPLRISLFGGGTDLPEWYNSNKGKTISFSINKYCYLFLRKTDNYFPYKYRFRYHKNENLNSFSKIKHPVIKVCLNKYLPRVKGIEIIHTADLPARTGLGSSSAFTVSLIHGLKKINRQKKISKKYLWKNAINIEQNILKEEVGSQDQIAVAEGGINIINYSKKNISIKRVISNNNFDAVRDNSLLVFLGRHRSAKKIEKSKINNMYMKKEYYKRIFDIANEGQEILLSNKDVKFNDLKNLFDESWFLKKNLSKMVSNKPIDNLFSFLSKKYGSFGKVLGAGGGGFALIISKDKNKKKKIKEYFDRKKIIYTNYNFDLIGSNISILS